MAEIAQICVKLHEDIFEIVWKYCKWISQLEYMLFDTQHVEIGPKMAELARLNEPTD